jgi:hypothetical protein
LSNHFAIQLRLSGRLFHARFGAVDDIFRSRTGSDQLGNDERIRAAINNNNPQRLLAKSQLGRTTREGPFPLADEFMSIQAKAGDSRQPLPAKVPTLNGANREWNWTAKSELSFFSFSSSAEDLVRGDYCKYPDAAQI